MKTIINYPKISSKFMLYGVGLVIACLLMMGLLMLSSRGYFAYKGKAMSNTDVNYLCKKLEAEKEPVCNGNKKIYPRDFSLLISNRFASIPSTYLDVQDVLGIFQMNFDFTSTGTLISTYDLNRDGKFDVDMTFESDNTLIAIMFAEDIGF